MIECKYDKTTTIVTKDSTILLNNFHGDLLLVKYKGIGLARSTRPSIKIYLTKEQTEQLKSIL